MNRATDPIIVIRGDAPAIPAVTAASRDAGWPIWSAYPVGQLLRRLFLERPEVAVVEADSEFDGLLRTLRERRPELSLVAVSADDALTELVALAAGAHAWLASAEGAEAIRDTAESMRRARDATHRIKCEPQPLARATG